MLTILTKRVIGCLGLFASIAASADILPGSGFQAAGWEGTARIRASGDFSYCIVRHAYDGGLELSLARSPEGLFFVGIKNAAWHLRADTDAAAKIAIDDGASRAEKATVAAPDTLLFTFWPRSGSVYAALLGTANRLSISDLVVDRHAVTAANTPLSFALAGTTEALAALGTCVTRYGEAKTAALQRD